MATIETAETLGVDWPLDQAPPVYRKVALDKKQLNRGYYSRGKRTIDISELDQAIAQTDNLDQADVSAIHRFEIGRDLFAHQVGRALFTASDRGEYVRYLDALASRGNRCGITRANFKGDLTALRQAFPQAFTDYDIESIALRGLVSFAYRLPNQAEPSADLFIKTMWETNRNTPGSSFIPITDKFIEKTKKVKALRFYVELAQYLGYASQLDPNDLRVKIRTGSLSVEKGVGLENLPPVAGLSLRHYEAAEPKIAALNVKIPSKDMLSKGLSVLSETIAAVARLESYTNELNNAKILTDQLNSIVSRTGEKLSSRWVIHLANMASRAIAEKDPQSPLGQAEPLTTSNELDLSKAIDRLLYLALSHLSQDQIAGYRSAGHCGRMLSMMGVAAERGETNWPAMELIDWKLRYAYVGSKQKQKLISQAPKGQADFSSQMLFHQTVYLPALKDG